MRYGYSVDELNWTRGPYGRYAPSDELNRYEEWNSWQVPASAELKE